MDCFRISGKPARYQVWMTWGIIAGIAVLSSCGGAVVSGQLAEPKPALQPVPPVPAHSVAPAIKLPDIQFTIQVGAFSTMERASVFTARLMRQGLDAYCFSDKDDLYKVRFDRFDSRKAASQRAIRLQELGWIDDYLIVRPVAQRRRSDPQLSIGQQIVRTAGRFLGTNYRWGGESADAGFDCSGLTMTVYRLNGLDLPRNSRDQFRTGTSIARSALREGDLVFFATGQPRRVSHVGIYAGSGRFIHAPGRGKTIRTSSLSAGYYNRRFVGARRYF